MLQRNDIIDERWRLIALLGRGGVGEVWRARPVDGGGEIGLKVLREEFSENATLRRRFAREARAASSLNHKNVGSIYAFKSDSHGRLYIAMELIEGPSLGDAVKTGLSQRELLDVSVQLLSGLAHAHARGVIHRDLKPDNILLEGGDLESEVGVPKIVDFGIATVAFEGEDRETMQGEVVGTPRYMSPEQALGERNLGPRTDLYNVGLILYELSTGHPPFGNDRGLAVMSRHANEAIPEPVPRPGFEFPAGFVDAMMRALSKNPFDRFASAGEMRDVMLAIKEVVDDDPQSVTRPLPLAGEEGENTPITAPELPGELRRTTPLDAVEPTDQESDGAAPAPAFAPWNFRVPFVGRTEERQLLSELARRTVEEGRGALVLLGGEAGVGKTRLTNWLKEEVEESGTMRANLGAFTREGSSSLRGAQEVLESIFRTRGLPRERVGQKIARRLEEWEYSSPGDAEAICDFVRPAHEEDTRPSNVSTAALFATIMRVLEAGARRKPRLIVLDDIHWAGRELIDFLDDIAVELRRRELPILIIATFRTEDLVERPEVETKISGLSRYVGESVERIELERFDASSARALIDALLPCEDDLAELILDRASGNPLHLLLLIRYLRQEGLLEWDGEKWTSSDSEGVSGAVPPSLGDLFRVRIEQAESHGGSNGRLTSLLEFAAIAGPRFHWEVLRSVALGWDESMSATFDVDLDRLIAEGFLSEVDNRGDWYGFSHGLLRDYLIHRVGPGRGRRLNRLAAESKQRVHARNVDQFALEIAHHLHEAREIGPALEWYLRGAKSALQTAMLRQATTAYNEALDLMDERLGVEQTTLEPLGPDLERSTFESADIAVKDYLDTLTRLGDLHEGFGEFPAAEVYYRRVVRLVGREPDRLPRDVAEPLGYAWLGLGHIAWQRGDFEAAEWAFRKVRELVKRHEAHSRLDEHAARGLARVAWHRGEYELAESLATQSHQSASRGGFNEGEAESLWILGEISRMQGLVDDAREHYARSLELYTSSNYLSGIARNLLSLAQAARYQKDFVSARDLYRRALAHYENLGDRRGQGQCHNGLGDIARFERRPWDAEESYRRALEIYESIGAEYDIAVALANLGLNSLGTSEYEAAEEYLVSALGLVEAGDFPYLIAGIEYNRALVKALSGAEAESDEASAKALNISERIGIADIDYAQPLEKLGQLRAQAGRLAEARQLWERAGQIYAELGLDADAERVRGFVETT